MGPVSLAHVGAVALGMLAGLNAMAVEQPAPLLAETEYLDEMPLVLTASRLAQPVSEAPGAVTVIDRDMIRASGFREIADLFRLVPGFYVGWYDGTMPNVSHGFADQFSRRMQVLVDGRSIYTPLYGGVEWSDLPLAMDDIERIEVVRGPNAASYGANAFMGIINIITRHAVEDAGVHLSVLSGNKGVGQGTFRLGGNAHDLDYRLTAGYREDDGFAQKYDSKRFRFFTFRGDYSLNAQDNLQVQLGYNTGKRGTGFPDVPVNAPHDVNIDSHYEQIRWQRIGGADSETSVQLYHTSHKSSENYSTIPFNTQIKIGPVTVPISVFATPLSADTLAERYDLEFQQIMGLPHNLRIVWGASYRLDQINSPVMFNTPNTLNQHLRRLFGNVEWHATPELMLNAGAMMETNDLTGTDTSPRVALNYHLSPQHTFRISFSQALRTPVLFEDRSDYRIVLNTSLGPYPVQLSRSLYDLLPEKITSREAGYIGQWGEQWSVDARVYQDKVGELISNYGTNNVAGFRTLDSATLGGTELQVKYRAGRDSQWIFNHSYSHVTSTSNSSNKYWLTSPVHLYGVLGMQRFAADWEGSVGYYHVGGLTALGDSRAVEAYQRLDLRLARRFKTDGGRGEVAAVLQNVLGNYNDFRTDNVFDRRAYLSLSLDY